MSLVQTEFANLSFHANSLSFHAMSLSRSTTKLPARYYARLQDLLNAREVSIDDLPARIGFDPASLALPDATLTLDQVDRLMLAIAERVNVADLAFEYGRSLRLSAHSALGFAMLSSPSVDYALALVSRFFGLILPSFHMHYRSDGSGARIRFRPAQAMSPVTLNFHLELIAVSTYFELSELMHGTAFGGTLRVSYSRPGHARRYQQLRGIAVQFESTATPEVEFEIVGPLANTVPAMADPWALKSTEAQCADLLGRMVRARGGVVDWIEMMLNEAHDHAPTLDEFARMLNMSERNLVRRLARRGRGFRQMSLDARMRRARILLETTDKAVTEIALELGYSDSANFTRAFRRANGLSPTEYRARAKRPEAGLVKPR